MTNPLRRSCAEEHGLRAQSDQGVETSVNLRIIKHRFTFLFLLRQTLTFKTDHRNKNTRPYVWVGWGWGVTS